MTHKLLSFYLLIHAMFSFAQTRPDQHLAKYKDNNTPYPLYAGSFGMKLKFTDADIKLLGENFDALYGSWDLDYKTANKIRSVNPDFDFLAYHGNWRVSGKDLQYVENGHLDEILYYRAGILENEISAKEKLISIEDLFGSVIPSSAHVDSSKSYHENSEFKFITFLKIGKEYMRIQKVEGQKIEVERAWSNSKANNHKKGTPILIPVYGRAPDPDSKRGYEYRQDERSMLRWERFLSDIKKDYNKHGGGIWIDILIGNLAHYAVSGETLPVNRIWDLERNQRYDPIDRAKNAERGIRFIQEAFFKEYGKYPVIWGNNMMFPTNLQNDRLRMLLKTDEKPRPIDGFAMENCFAQYGYGGHSGKKFMYTSYNDWQLSLQSIMYTGELKVSARPLIMDGGIDNKKFASLPKERRHELFLYSYASYLLGVKVEEDGSIYTKLGLCPFVFQEDGNHYAELDPCFLWDIGLPRETYKSQEYLKYKMEGRKVFVRKFENGIVLVNPSEDIEENIDLDSYGKGFINPDVPGKTISKITVKPRNGVILQNKKNISN